MELVEWILAGFLILLIGIIGLLIINNITADFEYEMISENLSYLSDETVIELNGGILTGTSGGEYLRIRYGITYPEGVRIYTEQFENKNIYIKEENTNNPRREIYLKQKYGKYFPFNGEKYGLPETLKTIYIVPIGTIKRNFEIDYR